ncbi:MAG: dTDP-4-dehydrorhamnose 3,5-epimerase [Kiritimatiellae bacterium]|nr:dTDP-4-dehydrorhamnose 3,5-epimerase [Kiritimatiellia bacterium]
MSFEFKELAIPGVWVVEAKRFEDARGYFMMSYRRSVFEAGGIAERFVQDNVSQSSRGVLRGLHYQLDPHAQGKLVMPLRGEIFDVAVDIRRGSATYGKWVGEHLKADTGRMMYVPPGFAHGFCVLSEEALFTYKVTAEYEPSAERGICWNDPEVGVEWPVREPVLSPRDAQLPLLAQAELT